MPPKRKRNAPVVTNGLAMTEKLKRQTVSSATLSRWGWVVSEVLDIDGITQDHRMAACNLSPRNRRTCCQNKYAGGCQENAVQDSVQEGVHASGEIEEDIIVISDDDEPVCSKKACKANPYCLNYLGQEIWEDEDGAMENFIKAAELGEDPAVLSREPDVPVGLKNLGATCYANASLQVWFRFAAFRSGVYGCEPPDNIPEEKYKDSPICQLQVTFAALQAGNKKVFNPTKLVESLQLRTSEQQDAQEFSKLFMTHLDAEFKKQSSPSLKSLITNQFQGTQVYGTICQSCEYRSETTSEFLEIEVSFKNNARLDDCISASLLPETLSGENRYLCPGCTSLQDAIRYTELRKLPPVLHFSLLRFVYDLNTMERKKSKNSISFPLSLDMNKFLGSEEDREHAKLAQASDNIYELRGILLHKGASAYHGHYEAQVYDAQHGSWFLFNDEHVTKVNNLGDKPPQKSIDRDPVEEDEKPDRSDVQKKRANARKRRRIEDSDDGDIIEIAKKITPSHSESLLASRDAYMLIYAKSDSPSKEGLCGPDSLAQRKPSHRTMQVVQDLNDAHHAECQTYEDKENALKAHFVELRSKVRAIYGRWNSTPASESLVISRYGLESWLSTHCVATALRRDGVVPTKSSNSSEESPNTISISCSDIICEHGFLDWKKSDEMKCISREAYERVVMDTDCVFTPALESSQVCSECVSVEFQERLYQIEHPRHIKQLDEVCNVADGEHGYWVSKKWLKDWRLLKPRMHVVSQNDPAPDSPEFHNHVYCEHGSLTMNSTNRRKISTQAVGLLQQLFPQWDPLPSGAEPCCICESEIHLSKEDKREIRRRIEDEKAHLRFILEPTLDAWTKRPEDVSYAVLPTQFVKNWKRWLYNPLEHQRPERIDNTPFLCQHDLLVIDPNCPSDLDSSIMIIQRDEWNVLNSIYEGGPLIALSKKLAESGSGYHHDMPVCEDCRTRRKTQWDMADIVIRYIGPNGSSTQKPIVTYGHTGGERQSKRLRQIREDGKRRYITVRKSSTVKDIKMMVQREFSLPTICQRLFHREQELIDIYATVESLQIFANDIIDVKEAEEMVDITSDSDKGPVRKKKKEEGNGFNGTLLGNADVPWCSSPEHTPHQRELEKICSACTFSNPSDVSSCQICDTAFV